MDRQDIKVIIGLIDRRIREALLHYSKGSGGIGEFQSHTKLRGMPSAVVADHDGRYYTESELTSTLVGSGASLIGIEDSSGLYASDDVEGALQEVLVLCSGITVIADAGPALGPRDTLHFIGGSGITIVAVDDPAENEIKITITCTVS